MLTGEKGYEVKSRALWRGTKRKVTKAEGQWADEVYVMMPGMKPIAVEAGIPAKKVHALWIPDEFYTCEPALLLELKRQLTFHNIHVKKTLSQAEQDCETVTERKLGITKGKADYGWEWLEGEYPFPVHTIESEQTAPYPAWHAQEGEKRKRKTEERELQELADFQRGKLTESEDRERKTMRDARRLFEYYENR